MQDHLPEILAKYQKREEESHDPIYCGAATGNEYAAATWKSTLDKPLARF